MCFSRRHLLVTAFLINAVASLIHAAEDSSAQSFLEHYCVKCHGGETPEADLRLDEFADLTAEKLRDRWHSISKKLSEREMPPEDAKQPSDTQRSKLLAWIKASYGAPPAAPSTVHWAFQPVSRPAVPKVEGSSANAIDAFVLAELRKRQLSLSQPADRRTLIRRLSFDLIGLPPTPGDVQAFVHDPAPLETASARVVDRLLRSPHYGERWAQHWLDVIRWAETVGFETNLEREHAWHYRDWVIDSLNEDKPYDRFVFEQIAGDTVNQDAALGFLVAGPANLPGQIGRDLEAMRQARQDELNEVIRAVSQGLFGLTIGCARCHDHKFDPVKQHDYYAMQAIFAGLSYGNRRLRGERNDQWTAQVPEAREKLSLLLAELEAMRKRHQLRPPLSTEQTESFDPVVTDAVRMEIAATDRSAASLYEFEVWSVADGDRSAENVALASGGACPSASSFALANQTRHFDNLVDGSIDKRQAFPWVAAEAGPAWLQINLLTKIAVDRIIWHAGESTPASYEVRIRDVKSGKWRTVAHTRDRLPRVDDMRSAKVIQLDGIPSEEVEKLVRLLAKIRAAQNELSRLTNGPQVYAASFTESPEDTWLLHRGDPMQRAEEVSADVPRFLQRAESEPPMAHEVDRRLALARHLIQPEHPLTARLMVNRIWQHHFGIGLVETPSDFGKMGAKPSHPELLDWLACEFVERGWSLKQLHRMIVTSQTYQQSSQSGDDALAVDADARLLWRYPPRRLDAEAIRDSILSVSGKLNVTMHGRGFDFFNQRGGLSDYVAKETFDADGWRRMIYAHKIRMESIDIFGAFDCPDAGQMTPRRNRSITPIQSLGLFNSPFVNRQAGFFAERIRRETADDAEKNIQHAFEIAFARPPSAKELARMRELAKAHGLEQVCRVIMNSSEFVFLQ